MIDIDHNPIQTEDGVWTPPFKGVEFLLAHVSSMQFQNKLARLQMPYAQKIAKGKLLPETQKEILCKAMAGTILKGWRGQMVDKQGNLIPYSDPVAERVLANHPDVREFVTEFSGDLDNFREEAAKEVGNS